jgi:hypothetical protein
LLQNTYRGLIAGGFITAAEVIVAFAALTAATQAFAQSSLGSSSATAAPAADYALPPPDGGSATPPDANPDDARSRAAVSKPSVAVKPVAAADNDSSAAAHSGWDRVGDVYTDTNSEGTDEVLEVPQVGSPTNSQPSEDADQMAQESGSQSQDLGPPPDQVGSIDDYQDEDDALMGAYGFSIPFAVVGINPYRVRAFRAPRNPRFAHGFGPEIPRAGGMNSAILQTSPMFPSGAVRFSGGMRGGHR